MPSMSNYFGKGTFVTLTGDLTLKRGSARVLVIDPNGPGRVVTLPNEDLLQLGGPHFYIINASSVNSFSVRQQNNYEIIFLGAEKAIELCLIRRETVSRWFAQEHDLVGTAVGKVTP